MRLFIKGASKVRRDYRQHLFHKVRMDDADVTLFDPVKFFFLFFLRTEKSLTLRGDARWNDIIEPSLIIQGNVVWQI